jgi:hypothetical protein
MAYTLEQLSADIRQTLKTDAGPAGKQAVCALVSKVLLDREFVAQHLTADQRQPRKVPCNRVCRRRLGVSWGAQRSVGSRKRAETELS